MWVSGTRPCLAPTGSVTVARMPRQAAPRSTKPTPKRTATKSASSSRAAKPVAKPAAKPVAKPAAKPVAKPAAKPVAEPAAEPVAKSAAKPVAKSAAKPAIAKSAPGGGVDKALLAAVIAEPDDDAPRLVYADHLSSAGDPRGEFIQVQCMLRRRLWGADGRSGSSKGEPSPPNAEQLRARELELFAVHAKTWLASARPYLQSWCWRRGFLDIVEANAKFLPGAAVVLAEHPLDLNFGALKAAELAALDGADLHDLRALELGSTLNNKTVRGLLGKNLSGLQTLNTTNTSLRDEGVAALATDSHLTSLRTWSLEGVAVETKGAAAIAASSVLRSLRVLNVRKTGVDADGVVAIARSSRLPALRTVVLGVHVTAEAGPEAVAELARRCEVITTDD
jgi:uncharacterized protein (TIGR02996 family)